MRRIALVLAVFLSIPLLAAEEGIRVVSWPTPPAAATPLDITTYTGPITAILGVVGPTTVHVTDF